MRSTNNLGGVDDFIPFEATMKAAKGAGLSVGDYIDEVMNGMPGATQATVDELRTLGVYQAKPNTVLEIGPGSGRYLEKTLMARVTRPGGRIVFDVMTETCLDPSAVRAWATEGGSGHDSYPAAMPRRTCVDLFATLD